MLRLRAGERPAGLHGPAGRAGEDPWRGGEDSEQPRPEVEARPAGHRAGNEFARGRFTINGSFTANPNTLSGGYSGADFLMANFSQVDSAVALAKGDFRKGRANLLVRHAARQGGAAFSEITFGNRNNAAPMFVFILEGFNKG